MTKPRKNKEKPAIPTCHLCKESLLHCKCKTNDLRKSKDRGDQQ